MAEQSHCIPQVGQSLQDAFSHDEEGTLAILFHLCHHHNS